jgi:hypothetical protein
MDQNKSISHANSFKEMFSDFHEISLERSYQW